LRDRRLLKETFRITPEYLRELHLDAEEVNFCDYGIQLTRTFRALKVWMSLQVFGLRAFREAIAWGIELAEIAERRLRQSPVWEIVTPAQMGIVTFRHRGDDEVQESLVERMAADGLALLTSTALRGRRVLRLCTINPRTTPEDIEATIERLESLAARS
jgi:glutamate/tyrosine decarboxylase-like PLP-dependent enzyme